jgi:hypothetical protein
VIAGSTVASRLGLDTNWIAVTMFQTNGTIDPSFRVRGAPPMSYFQSEMRQLFVQSDGKILFCAAIYDGPNRTMLSLYLPSRATIGRLLPDGTWDSSFGLISCDLTEVNQIPGPFWFNNLPSSLTAQPYQPVPAAAFAQQPDGITVLAGSFNSVNGEPRRRIARLDPTGALRGRLQLGFASTQPQELIFPEEVETPYTIETSTDLAHWMPLGQNDYPWRSLQFPVAIDAAARYFRAHFLAPPGP